MYVAAFENPSHSLYVCMLKLTKSSNSRTDRCRSGRGFESSSAVVEVSCCQVLLEVQFHIAGQRLGTQNLKRNVLCTAANCIVSLLTDGRTDLAYCIYKLRNRMPQDKTLN
jgi:hypothetical protein